MFLRWFMVSPPAGFNYKYLLHAHSHVAILGWLYSAFFTGLLQAYLPEHKQKKIYWWQFWLAQLAVLGMLLSFPVQGYALFSIIFSTLHILICYWFIYRFLADARQAGLAKSGHALSFRFIKAALFFLAFSTLGPWSLGPVMATGHSGSHLYYNAIYFYLHFQYNGWLSFAVFGLLFWLLERYGIPFSQHQALLLFRLFFWSCLLGFLLSILWTKPPAFIFYLAGVAALVQGIGLLLLLSLLYKQRLALAALISNRWSRLLFFLSTAAVILKITMQLTTALPYMASLAYTIRNFIIGYLHLVLIGFVSFFLLAYFIQQGHLNTKRRSSQWGLGIFIIGFFLSEGLLFLQGLFFWLEWGALPEYFRLLFWSSALLPAGLLLFIVGQRKTKAARMHPLVTTPETGKLLTD